MGEAKGLYWNEVIEEVGNYLTEGENREVFVMDAKCGLIK